MRKPLLKGTGGLNLVLASTNQFCWPRRQRIVLVLCTATGIAQAEPFSLTVPGTSIPDGYLAVVDLTIPAEFGSIQLIDVEISGLSHGKPDDLDIYLISPYGEYAMLMTDRGGNGSATNLTLVFSDDALDVPLEDGPIDSGTFKPEGLHEGSDQGLAGLNYSKPAVNPWSLLIIDDASSASGEFDSFTIRGHSHIPVAVPAVSDWSLIILTLTGSIAATLIFSKRSA